MKYFARFLGKENGKTMIYEIATSDCTKEQLRCAVTTYCILFDVEVDTKEWDFLMIDLFDYNCFFENLDEFDGFMSECLI